VAKTKEQAPLDMFVDVVAIDAHLCRWRLARDDEVSHLADGGEQFLFRD
jgi:hypothetical protein